MYGVYKVKNLLARSVDYAMEYVVARFLSWNFSKLN